MFGRPKLAGNSTYNAIMGRYQANPRKPKTYHTSTISRLADPFVGKFSPSRHFEVEAGDDDDVQAPQPQPRAKVHAEEGFFLTACDDDERVGGAGLPDSSSSFRKSVRGGLDPAGGNKRQQPQIKKAGMQPRTTRAVELKRSKGKINPRLPPNALDPKSTGDIKSKFVSALISGKRGWPRDTSLDRSQESMRRNPMQDAAGPRSRKPLSKVEELRQRKDNPASLNRSRQNAVMKVVKRYNEHGRVTSVEKVMMNAPPKKATNGLRDSTASMRKEWIDPMSASSGAGKQHPSVISGQMQRRPARHESTIAENTDSILPARSLRTGVLVGSKSASSVKRLRESVQKERQQDVSHSSATDATPVKPIRRSFSGQAAVHPSKSSKLEGTSPKASPKKAKSPPTTYAERKAILMKTEADKIHKSDSNTSLEKKATKKESPKKTPSFESSLKTSTVPEVHKTRRETGTTETDVLSALQRAENLAASISADHSTMGKVRPSKSRGGSTGGETASNGASAAEDVDTDAQALAALLATHAKRISGSLASAQKYADEYKKLAGTFE